MWGLELERRLVFCFREREKEKERYFFMCKRKRKTLLIEVFRRLGNGSRSFRE